MRRVLAHALTSVLLLGVSSAEAYERRELDPPHLLSPGGDTTRVAAVEQTPADVAIDQPMAPPAMPKEAVAIAPPAPPPPPPITLLLKADLTTQKLIVREGDRVLHVWPISSGRRGYATPTGTFRPAWMARMWRSRQYDDAPMPHSIFFNKGIAFHATTAVSMLGRPASHGCLRLAPAHAAQLFALVRRHGLVQTKVVVQGAAPFPPVAVARREPTARRKVTAGNSQLFSAAQWLFMQ
jgi:lipoprotein-anchoring transpeptidase ErfK/SrfK